MGHHCCSKQKVKRGLWSPEEDEKLIQYITNHGHSCWSSVPKHAGLQRCGKSCRLRWINYLRPDLKRGSFSAQEERIIIDVHRILGNRWAQIAKHLPGRTDNEVKNFWNSCIKKKLIAQGLDPKTHKLFPASRPAASSNLTSSNLSQFHHQQQSTTSFTISSHVKGFETAMKNNSMEMNPHSLNLTPHPNLPLHETIHIPSFQYQDPSSVFMTFKDQNSHAPMDFAIGSASMDHANLSPFNQPGFMDEACMWSSGVEPLEAPKEGEIQPQQGHCKVGFNDGNEEKGLVDMETYNSASYDLDLMESALMPCGVFCGGSSMDQFPWDC